MARTTITRLRTKASQDRSELDRLLDSITSGTSRAGQDAAS